MPGRRPIAPEYTAWVAMIQRCHNSKHPRFSDYGARGISVCGEWLNSYPCFLAHVGPRPFPDYSLDRKENSAGYEPGNVQWATSGEQAKNRRSSRPIRFRGTVKTLIDWARDIGVAPTTLYRRLSDGWSLDGLVNNQRTALTCHT